MLFRKKPIVVEAIQFTGENTEQCLNFITCKRYAAFVDLVLETEGEDETYTKIPVIVIRTLEGEKATFPNEWIIRGINGEFYPCGQAIFAEKYEPVNTTLSEEACVSEKD